jgi:protein-S-isoprenylcysteine O-methyltransferase Ste14
MGWAALGAFVAGTLGLSLVALTGGPGLAEERLRPGVGAKSWDRHLTSAAKMLLIAGMLPVSRLDHRFSWSPQLAAAPSMIALAVFALGYAAVAWAMRVNPFFSSVVRIQVERAHAVAVTGPYRYVRHPAYLAIILQFLAVHIALGSFFAYIPATLACGVYVLRTALEDGTLRGELAGHSDYAARVRYRLLPGVW